MFGILLFMLTGVGLDARLGLPFAQLRAAAREAGAAGGTGSPGWPRWASLGVADLPPAGAAVTG